MGVRGGKERGHRQAGRLQLLADRVNECQQVSEYNPPKDSGEIASGAKENSPGAPYGLCLQSDIVTQMIPLLGKLPRRR